MLADRSTTTSFPPSSISPLPSRTSHDAPDGERLGQVLQVVDPPWRFGSAITHRVGHSRFRALSAELSTWDDRCSRVNVAKFPGIPVLQRNPGTRFVTRCGTSPVLSLESAPPV